jgi:hypothetical protein
MGDGMWTGERYIPDMGALGDFAGPGWYRGGTSDSGPGWIATLVMLAPSLADLTRPGLPFVGARSVSGNNGS